MDAIFQEELSRRSASSRPIQTYDTLEAEIGKVFSGEHTKTRHELVKKITRCKVEIRNQRKRLPRTKGEANKSIRERITKLNKRIESLEDQVKQLPLPENMKHPQGE